MEFIKLYLALIYFLDLGREKILLQYCFIQ